MNKILVWDIPARLFHWAFAASLTASIAIGFLVDDEQPLFQLHMIHKQQTNVVNLLSLQRRARDLALSDPLTGLLNRRALLDTALALGAQGPVRLLLIDIDNFKAINDGHGHDKGDEVLCEVAERLAIRADLMGSVARIGA